ncbi:UNVERIFIED_CONTAM: hypothetical protein Sradi_6524000 [Sesamum radiatum]|uniref:Uncharacterized protein n=1 Tax=Sesamum radiatum TaxID=300843 RepID=A0AAW2JXB0_SESRA
MSSTQEQMPSFEQSLKSFSRGLISSVPCKHISTPPQRHLSPTFDGRLILPPMRSLSPVPRRHLFNKPSSKETQ